MLQWTVSIILVHMLAEFEAREIKTYSKIGEIKFCTKRIKNYYFISSGLHF